MNANYDQAYFQENSNSLPQIEFRRRLEKKILENTIDRYGNEEGSGAGLRSRMEMHKLITKPPFTGKWIPNTRRWHKVTGKYQQFRCNKLSKQTLTYFKCCKGIFFCAHCFAVHVLEKEGSHTTNH